MAPNVSVPMNFGKQLLDSPTHSTLELRANNGATVRASSVILSFNSAVIDHMTTTLHLTSVDMEEFSEEAVRYFVDAAYSGETPPVSRDMFRDINKMGHVFEMTWLVTRFAEIFASIAEAVQEPSYQDFVFLFDEAVFVLTKLKSRQFIEIAFTKIRSLSGEQDFISRYLENLTSLSRQQLDLIMELTGTNVEFVVEPLTEQLTASLSRGETVVSDNCKYLLENSDLYSCQQHNAIICEQLFDVLEQVCLSQDSVKWAFQLLRKLIKKPVQSVVSQQPTTTAQCSVEIIIPNLFHTLDCSMTFDETVDWLGKSEQVTNLLMFFEGLWMWMLANKNYGVNCSAQLLDKISEIKAKRVWECFFFNWLTFKNDGITDPNFFPKIQSDRRFCTLSYDQKIWTGVTCEQRSVNICSVFEKQTKLTFHIPENHPAVKDCLKSGKCGFILKTVPVKDGAKMLLCTDPSDYSEEIHYHEELQAKNVHFCAYVNSPKFSFLPLSWTGTPVLKSGEVWWDNMLPECKQGVGLLYLLVDLRDQHD